MATTARATLSSTTFASTVGATDTLVKVSSTSGFIPGQTVLFADGELMAVQRLDVDSWVRVKRGEGGTPAVPHTTMVTLYIGQPHQFFEADPTGRPAPVIEVSPYINVRNNTIWLAQGDGSPSATADRWWQKQTDTRSVGALGVRTLTQDPTVST